MCQYTDMEITTKEQTVELTKGTRYAFSVKGKSHGYCDAELIWIDGNNLIFQPYTSTGEKDLNRAYILRSDIDQIEER